MDRFFGSVLCPISPEGRLRLPVGPGSVSVGDRLVATRGPDRSVLLYPLDVWETDVEGAARDLPHADRAHFRTLMMWAEEVTVSASWEVELPAALLEVAGLSERALVVGRGDYIDVKGSNPECANWDDRFAER